MNEKKKNPAVSNVFLALQKSNKCDKNDQIYCFFKVLILTKVAFHIFERHKNYYCEYWHVYQLHKIDLNKVDNRNSNRKNVSWFNVKYFTSRKFKGLHGS